MVEYVTHTCRNSRLDDNDVNYCFEAFNDIDRFNALDEPPDYLFCPTCVTEKGFSNVGLVEEERKILELNKKRDQIKDEVGIIKRDLKDLVSKLKKTKPVEYIAFILTNQTKIVNETRKLIKKKQFQGKKIYRSNFKFYLKDTLNYLTIKNFKNGFDIVYS